MELLQHPLRPTGDAARALPRGKGNQAPIRRIAMIGNHPPRRCGIATFTADMAQALRESFPDLTIDVWAVNDGRTYAYPPGIAGTIEQQDLASYRAAAREITASGADVVCIQHEFGIFGGEAGSHILALIDRLAVPVAVVLHTVLANPTLPQRKVMRALVERCETLIAMAEEGRRILEHAYKAEPGQVVVIPHGAPDRPLTEAGAFKTRLGLAGRKVLLTFGLISPGKGVETVVRAMPAIAAAHPDALYLVLGATHPHCIAHQGEKYRETLESLAGELGVADHVRLIDAFFETGELLDYLGAADVYVTPYLNPDQITSGTLSYAFALGKPIVSTPYVHARELLAGGDGALVDFGDSEGFARAICGILDDPDRTARLRRRIYERGRATIWPNVAEAAMHRFESMAEQARKRPVALRQPALPLRAGCAAALRLTDATGMLQHSLHGVPDRRHGYCIDDNARALMLACMGPPALRARFPVYAAFVQHGWNEDEGRFRNFMSYERRWLEDCGSDDSNGRTLWALGVASEHAPDAEARAWATGLFEQAADALSSLASPRAIAFMILGAIATGSAEWDGLVARWAARLAGLLAEYRRADWEWFEPYLAYDNARLSQAMIAAGAQAGRAEWLELGLKTLDWLNRVQSAPNGDFRAVGTDSFGRLYAAPLPFDQQPLEAWAMVDACDAAHAATGASAWRDRALNAYRWFLGKNELAIALADPETGECFDGLMPTGVNRNRGAESVLAFQLATIAIQRLRSDPC